MYQALVAAKNTERLAESVVSPAVAAASVANAAAASTASCVAAASAASAAATPLSPTEPTDKDVEKCFASESEDEAATLQHYNKSMQAKRARDKAALERKKEVAAELASEKAVKKAALAKQKAKKKAERAKKKVRD